MTRSPARLSRSVSFRLNEADYARLAYQAAVLNLRVNELARILAMDQGPTMSVQIYRSVDPALITQLIALGNNLNQMVKRFHMSGRVSPHLADLCLKIEELIDRAIEEGDA